MSYSFKNIFLLSLFLFLPFKEINSSEINEPLDFSLSPNLSFSGFESGTGIIGEDQYFNFIRDSIIS